MHLPGIKTVWALGYKKDKLKFRGQMLTSYTRIEKEVIFLRRTDENGCQMCIQWKMHVQSVKRFFFFFNFVSFFYYYYFFLFSLLSNIQMHLRPSCHHLCGSCLSSLLRSVSENDGNDKYKFKINIWRVINTLGLFHLV